MGRSPNQVFIRLKKTAHPVDRVRGFGVAMHRRYHNEYNITRPMTAVLARLIHNNRVFFLRFVK